MDWILATLFFLHIGGAIVAFGPSFTFPIIGAMSGREPQHVNFALRLQERLGSRLVLPLAVFQGVTGLLLIWRTGRDVFASAWMPLAILLYLSALALALFVSLPTVRKLVAATSAPPPPPPAGGPPTGGHRRISPASSAALAGPASASWRSSLPSSS